MSICEQITSAEELLKVALAMHAKAQTIYAEKNHSELQDDISEFPTKSKVTAIHALSGILDAENFHLKLMQDELHSLNDNLQYKTKELDEIFFENSTIETHLADLHAERLEIVNYKKSLTQSINDLESKNLDLLKNAQDSLQAKQHILSVLLSHQITQNSEYLDYPKKSADKWLEIGSPRSRNVGLLEDEIINFLG